MGCHGTILYGTMMANTQLMYLSRPLEIYAMMNFTIGKNLKKLITLSGNPKMECRPWQPYHKGVCKGLTLEEAGWSLFGHFLYYLATLRFIKNKS